LLHCSTVAEVLAQLEQEENDSTEVVDIFMEPPADEGVSDQDSDKSDGEYEFSPITLDGNCCPPAVTYAGQVVYDSANKLLVTNIQTEKMNKRKKNMQLGHPVLNHLLLHDEVINLQGRKNARLRNQALLCGQSVRHCRHLLK